MKTQTSEIYHRLALAGVAFADCVTLRRISMTLHRWFELECGDGNDYASWSIERDDATGKPYMVTHPHNGKSYRRPIADRETGAKKRLAKVMAKYPGLTAYTQGDPRGAALYILRPEDIRPGLTPDACYTNGIAVY